jgi:hypothetical protein
MSSTDIIHQLVLADTIDFDALESTLDAADHDTRVAATRRWNGKLQKKLFDQAEGRSVTHEQVLPTDELGQEVIHVGTNTLPAFRAFEKRFCWVNGADGRYISGYNHQEGLGGLQMWATTPGYYVAYDDTDNGEFVIDYRKMPDHKADSWPAIEKNSAKLGLLVYAGMVDRLRRVSDHVTIGRAYKKKPMNAWFVLVRDDDSFS